MANRYPVSGKDAWCEEELSILRNFRGEPDWCTEICVEILIRAGYDRTLSSVKGKLLRLDSKNGPWVTEHMNDLRMYAERWRQEKIIRTISGQNPYSIVTSKKALIGFIADKLNRTEETCKAMDKRLTHPKRADPWYPTEEHLLGLAGLLSRLPGRSDEAKLYKRQNREAWKLDQDRELLVMARRFELDWAQIQNYSRNNKTFLEERNSLDMKWRYVELVIGLPLAKTKSELDGRKRSDAVEWTNNEKMKLCNAVRDFWEQFPEGIRSPEGKILWPEFAAEAVHTRNADQCERKYNEFLRQINVNVHQTVESLLKLLPAITEI